MYENARYLFGITTRFSDADLERREFQVLRTGEFYDPRYGKFAIDKELLGRIKKNFDDKVLGIDVALDKNHEPEKGAMAWIESLDIRDGSLYARFRDFTTEGMQALKEKAFRYFSVEFSPLEKVKDGKRVTIKDVLRGIALTNRPVVKEMQPTFFSEDDHELTKLFTHPTRSMNAVKVFAERLVTRGNPTNEEVSNLKLMVAALSEEERKIVQPDVDKVEAEAKKFAEAETKRLADEKAAKEKQGKTPEELMAAEKATLEGKLAEETAKNAKLLAEKKEAAIDASVEGMILSEKNLTGFAADKKADLRAFVATLSEEQAPKFAELVKTVKTVDAAMLTEMGHGKEGEEKGNEDKQLAEVETVAAKLMSEDKSLAKHDAITKAQKQVFAKK